MLKHFPMSLLLDNYKLARVEWCCSLFSFSGLPLSVRHWAASSKESSQVIKWGHRLIAVLEAYPILGVIVAAIEMIVANYLKISKPSISSENPPCLWDGASTLPFNNPILLTVNQLVDLGFPANCRFSQLHQYSDSIFRVSFNGSFYPFAKIVRIKNDPLINGIKMQIPPIKGPASLNEGLRVRTFCLELISNFEDQVSLQTEPKKIEELIQCVKYYIENIAFGKKAGFLDYKDFLATLMKEAPEYRSIFSRHFMLVDLQESLPKQGPQKSSRWEKIRIVVRSGLLTTNLCKYASQAIKLGLRPFPPVPKREPVFKLYPILDAINLLAADYREAGRWLIHQTRLITFRELCCSIKKSSLSLNKEIANWDDYTRHS